MGLNKEQAEAVNHVYGPMLVLAGPGSGKTFTLVERVRHLIEDAGLPPEQILVITFSKKAALEMQARFTKLTGDKQYPVSFGTFHAIFYHIIKQYKSYSSDSVLTSDMKIKYLRRACQQLGINQAYNETWVCDILSKFSNYKSMKKDDNKTLSDICLNDIDEGQFISIYKLYYEMVKNDGKIDFDDMLYECFDILNNNLTIRSQWQNKFRYFLVDEFQDINEVQYETLMLLAGEEKNIFAVGDDDQSIYGFRGAEPSIMKKFLSDNNSCKTVNLCKNYRCPECVVNKAGKLISNNADRIDKYQISMKKDTKEGNVFINNFMSNNEEADYIISEILKIKEETKCMKSIAVLYRTSRCAAVLQEKMLVSNIPYETKEEIKGFYENEWVEDIILYLKLAIGKGDVYSLFRIINRPYREISREFISNFLIRNNFSEKVIIDNSFLKALLVEFKTRNNSVNALEKLIHDIVFLSSLSPFAAVNFILKGVGYESYLKIAMHKKGVSVESVQEYIEELLERSKEFTNIKSWIEYVDLVKELEEKKQITTVAPEKVRMMTAHASKGLEFDNVFVIGLQEGLFPHNKAVTQANIEEERRLMYVAMTRARKNLHICGRGDEKGKKISRFIAEIL